MKSTQQFVPKGDLHFHIRGNDNSACYDMAHAVSDVLEPVAISIEEIHSFRYWDGRSILGFVDGTKIPRGTNGHSLVWSEMMILSIKEVVIFLSKNIFMIYLHLKNYLLKNRKKYLAGYKSNDIEMPDNIKPSNSHIALANVGDEFKIIRDNMPFGNISTNEMGTYFIAYASTFSI